MKYLYLTIKNNTGYEIEICNKKDKIKTVQIHINISPNIIW